MIDFQDLRLNERLRELDLRTWLNENSAITTIAAVVLLMIALGVMLMTVTGGGAGGGFEPPTQKYFYDLNTGELFAVPLDELPPIDRGAPYALPNGQTMPAGVEAVVFGAEGADPSELIVGWVETLRPEKRDEIVAAQAAAVPNDANSDMELYGLIEQSQSERLVMDPEASEPIFVPRFSERGMQIMARRFTDDDGEPLRPVFPD